MNCLKSPSTKTSGPLSIDVTKERLSNSGVRVRLQVLAHCYIESYHLLYWSLFFSFEWRLVALLLFWIRLIWCWVVLWRLHLYGYLSPAVGAVQGCTNVVKAGCLGTIMCTLYLRRVCDTLQVRLTATVLSGPNALKTFPISLGGQSGKCLIQYGTE